jgi:hypothetical protein
MHRVVFGGAAAQVTPAETRRAAKLKHLQGKPEFRKKPGRRRGLAIDRPSMNN